MSEGGASVIPARSQKREERVVRSERGRVRNSRALPIVRARSLKAAEPKPPSTIIPVRASFRTAPPSFPLSLPVIPAPPPSFPRKRESTGASGLTRETAYRGMSWERGRPARNAALACGDTLTLALSHKGRGDPLTAIRAWFRVAGLVHQPASPSRYSIFARKTKNET